MVMATSDPANVYSLSLEGVERDAFTRPRGTGAYVVTVAGTVVVSVEGRGRRLNIRPDADEQSIKSSVAALIERLSAQHSIGRRHDLVVETINGEAAAASGIAPLLQELGFRREGLTLRRYATIK